MARWAKQFRKGPGEYGTTIIEESGLCLDSDAPAVEAGCTKRYRMVPYPNAAGAVMKVLDGTNPAIVAVVPPNPGTITHWCVKVSGIVEPYAAAHEGGLSDNHHIVLYTIRYQEVGSVA